MPECKLFIVSNKQLSNLEMETLSAKFRKGNPDRHRIIWCRKERAMVVAAPYGKPMEETKLAIRKLVALYKPDMVQAVGMPRVAA